MRESRLFIILISLVMGLVGCSKETMIGEYVDRCAVRLDIDWGPCGIDPDGMTVLFYPVDGGEPSRFLTNMVTGDEVRLRKGIYNVVVFNQAAEDDGKRLVHAHRGRAADLRSGTFSGSYIGGF